MDGAENEIRAAAVYPDGQPNDVQWDYFEAWKPNFDNFSKRGAFEKTGQVVGDILTATVVGFGNYVACDDPHPCNGSSIQELDHLGRRLDKWLKR
jgi:hypothetical protein